MNIYTLPFVPEQAQIVSVALAGVTYQLRLIWCVPNAAWTLDIYDSTGTTAVVTGIPLVTGADLLAQYAYLGIGGQIIVQTVNDVAAVPTFDDLGVTGFAYFIVQTT